LQPVSIVVHDPASDSPPEVRLSGRVSRVLEHGRDIRLSNYTDKPKVTAGGEVVFVGFGIDAPIYGWNDFAGVDLRGKVAVGLIGEPTLADSSRFNGVRASRYSWTEDKTTALERQGAIGVLWVRPAGSFGGAVAGGARRLAERARDSRVFFTGVLADSTLASLVAPGQGSLADLIAAASKEGFTAKPLGVRLDVAFETRPRVVTTHNVVGTVNGTDSGLADDHVVLSSHWDAYGVGAPVKGDSVYNGALDDGSGMIVELALARIFARHPQPRSITFLFTTSEEWGLIGAEAFVRGGPLRMGQVVANLNIDDGMELFGPKRDVAPLGVELSTLGAVVDSLARGRALRVAPDPFPEEGFFLRADNYPFARAGVPALYMALGTDAVDRPAGWTDGKVKEYLEQHYHKPSDDYETVVVDLAGSRQLAELTRDLTIAVARARSRPAWLRGSEFSREPVRP
jgi:Zn-dependent M28 family amino/carboxypeptidase